MSTTVDSLDIQITATSTKASKSIDQLVGKLNTLSASLKGINGSNLSGLANGVAKLGQSVQTLNGVKGSDYTRIANGLNKFANINASGMIKTSSGLHVLSRGLSSIGNIQNIQNITPAINAVKNLSRVDMSGFDTTKLDAIQKSFTSFANSLSTVGDIDSKVTRLVNGMARLSGSGQYISNVTTEFPTLSRQVVKFAEDLQKVGTVDANVTKIVDGIARLASAGKKSAETAKSMDNLGNAVTKLLDKLRRYPNINANVANTIQGLGNLASSGSRISSTVNSVSHGLKRFSIFGNRASKSSRGLASSIGLLYAKFWILLRAVKGLWGSVKSSQDYIEDFNYFAVALGKVAEDSKNQFKKAGFNSASEYAKSFKTRFSGLQKQMTGYIVDANTGNLTYGMSHNLGLDISQIMRFQSAITQITNSAGMLGETSIMTSKALSMLSADWSSLSNQNLSDVMQNMQSALIGQSRAVYKYGIDITSAGLAQTAYNHGLDISIKDLSQSSKMQLRLLTILEQSKVAYGDLARTINQPANQLRMLQAGFKNLSRTIGSIFMPIVQKLYPYLNAMVMVLQEFAEWIAKMTGVNLANASTSISMPDYSDAADDSDNLASNTEKAAKSAKKLSDNIQGFDVINKLQENDKDSSGDDNGGNGKNLDLSKQIANALGNYEKIWNKAFRDNRNKAVQLAQKIKSTLLSGWRKGGDFTELGKSFAQWINKGLANIPWKKIQKTVNKLSRSLATFLNGAIKDLNWSLIGETASDGLNTVFGGAYTFVSTFNWLSLGNGIAEGINSAIRKADFKKAGKTLGSTLRGIIQSAFGLLTNLNYAELGRKISDAINGFFNDMGEVRKNTGLTGWQELGISISSTIKGIVDTIKTSLLNVNWGEVGKAIGQFIGSIDWLGILANVGSLIVTALFSSIKVAIKAIATDPVGLAKALTAVLSTIFVYKKLKGVVEALRMNLAPVISSGINKAISKVSSTKIATALTSKIGSIGGLAISVTVATISFKFAHDTWKNVFDSGYSQEEIKNALADMIKGSTTDVIITSIFGEKASEKVRIAVTSFLRGLGTLFSGEYSFNEWTEGFKSWLNDLKKLFKTSFDLIIADAKKWFTKEKWFTVFIGIKTGLQSQLSSVKKWWSNNAMTAFWEIVSASLSVTKWISEIGSIKNAFKEKWNEMKTWFSETGVTSWWKTFSSNFTKGKWKEAFGGIKDGLESAFSVAIACIKITWNKFAKALNKMLSFEMPKIEVAGKKIFGGQKIELGVIPTFATGGFPEDGLFFANHNELVGKYTNGKTAVANNDQITQGFADGITRTLAPAVYSAVKQAIREEMSNTGGTGDVYLDGEKVTKNVVGHINKISKTRNSSPLWGMS